MLNAFALMVLLGTTSWLIMGVLDRDERKRKATGDVSGPQGKSLASTKLLLVIVIGAAAGAFILLIANDDRKPGMSGDGGQWECSGSMRC